MQKAYNQNLNIIAKPEFFLKNGCLEKQMKEANQSLKTETIFYLLLVIHIKIC